MTLEKRRYSNGTWGRVVRAPADGSDEQLLPKLRSKDRDSRSRRLRGRRYRFGICNLKFGFCNAMCVVSVSRKSILGCKPSIPIFMVILLIVMKSVLAVAASGSTGTTAPGPRRVVTEIIAGSPGSKFSVPAERAKTKYSVGQ